MALPAAAIDSHAAAHLVMLWIVRRPLMLDRTQVPGNPSVNPQFFAKLAAKRP